MNPEHLAPMATILEIEPSELSVLTDCDVSLDALNFLGKRMDGMCKAELRQFLAVLGCEEVEIGYGLKNIINLTDNVPHTEQILGILNKYKFDTYAIAADSGYDSSEIYSEMYRHGIKCFIVPQKRSGNDVASHVMPYENLKYNKNLDCYFCSEGQKIEFKSYSVGTGYKHYSIDRKMCDKCPHRASCREPKILSLGIHERERREQQKFVDTDEWKDALRLRQIWCEGNFARQKESHNLNRTRRRGIENMREQCLLSACALNLKRMVKCRE